MDREVQGETQGRPKRCEVADDSVVVKKSRPVKPGNSSGGENRDDLMVWSMGSRYESKAILGAKGESLFEGSLEFCQIVTLEHKPTDGKGHFFSGKP